MAHGPADGLAGHGRTAQFGGGGHVRAAGCTSELPMLLLKQQLIAAIRAQLDSADDKKER